MAFSVDLQSMALKNPSRGYSPSRLKLGSLGVNFQQGVWLIKYRLEKGFYSVAVFVAGIQMTQPSPYKVATYPED